MMWAYTLRLAHEVGVPELYFMSPNLNTDYFCFKSSTPHAMMASPITAVQTKSIKFAFGSESIPPTDPNTTKNPTINLIILCSLVSNNYC